MNLRLTFLNSLLALVLMAAALLVMGEETPFPSAITLLVAVVAYVVVDRRQQWQLPALWANFAGLLAAAAAIAEFLGPNIEARLLAGVHFLVYLTWIVLLRHKHIREFWWLGSFALLQVAVGAVLNNSATYGLLMLAFVLLALWTLAVGNVYFRAIEYRLLPADPLAESPDLAPATPAGDALGQPGTARASRPSLIDRHGLLQQTPGHWLGSRFLWRILLTAGQGVVLGVLLFLLVPRLWIGSGNPFLNSSVAAVRAVTGNSNEVRLGHLVQILEDSSRVFQVRFFDRDSDRELTLDEFLGRVGQDEALFRNNSLETYEGGRWKSRRSEPRFQMFPGIRNVPGLLRQEYLVDSLDTATLPGVHPIDMGRIREPRQNLERNLGNGALVPGDGEAGTKDYYLWSLPQEGSRLPPLKQLDSRGRTFVAWKDHLQLPPDIPQVVELANRWVGDLPSGLPRRERAIADRLIARLRDSGEYSYSLEMKVQDFAIDPVADFLLNTRSGHCEYYASALALLLRTQGIPSRLVTGYKGAEQNTLTGAYDVQRRHAHAWVEAFFDDDWQTLDAVPAAREDEVRRFRADRGFWGNTRDSLSLLWSDYVVAMSPDRQERRLWGPLRESVGGLWDRTRNYWNSLFEQGAQGPTDGNSLATKLLALFVGALLVLRGLRNPVDNLTASWRQRQTQAGVAGLIARLLDRWLGPNPVQQKVVEFYDRFTQATARQGVIRPPHQTQHEFAAEIARHWQPQLAAAGLPTFPAEITRHFYDVRFGDRVLPPETLTQIERQLESFTQAIASPAPAPKPS
ncbi:MAG: DUF4129 domain-containing transglutaminase family protein [Planctomycetaceae bacterium]